MESLHHLTPHTSLDSAAPQLVRPTRHKLTSPFIVNLEDIEPGVRKFGLAEASTQTHETLEVAGF